MALALSGLASGLDTDSLISALMSTESQGKTRLQLADLKASSRQDTLKDLTTRLNTLKTATATLRSATTWSDKQTVSSTDATRVGVRALGGVAPGDHTVGVNSIAVAAQRAFTVGSAAGSISIGAYNLNVDADTSAATLAERINSDTAAPVSAVVAGDSLVFTARQTGAASDFTVSAAGVLTEQPSYARAGADASYTVDGVAKTSASNVITDAVLGMEITLKAPTASAAVVSASNPAPDQTAIKAAVKSVVDAYNSAQDLMRAKLGEQRVKDASTNVDALKGLFNGDVLLQGATAALRGALGDLSDLGISTGSTTGSGTVSKDAVAGKLVIDDTKLTAAIAADPQGIRTRLAGDTGWAASLGGVAGDYATDRITARLSSEDAQRKRISDDLTATSSRLTTKEAALRAKFAAMETALSKGQQQLSWLQGQISALG